MSVATSPARQVDQVRQREARDLGLPAAQPVPALPQPDVPQAAREWEERVPTLHVGRLADTVTLPQRVAGAPLRQGDGRQAHF